MRNVDRYAMVIVLILTVMPVWADSVMAQNMPAGPAQKTGASTPAAVKNTWDGSVSGIYQCEQGIIKISQRGKTVAGNYDWSGGGSVCGSLEGAVMNGTFADKYGSGDVKYTFDASGFRHNWRFAGESTWREGPRARKMQSK